MGAAVRAPQLAPLTGVRFFAALHVVLFHSRAVLEGNAFFGHRWLSHLVGAGPVSVGLFFVLSGFVVTYTYLGGPGKPQVRRRSFWVARLARIYPVYLLGLLLALPFVLAFPQQLGASPLLGAVGGASVVVLVQAWVPRWALAWNPPAWSLSAEAFFYLVFPFAAPPLARLGRRGAVVALAALWALALAIPAALLAAGARGGIDVSNVLAYNPLIRLPEFLLGVVLARLYLLRRETDPQASRLTGKGSVLALAALGALLVLLGCDPAVYGPFAFAVINGGVLAPLFGLLVYGLACGGGPLAAVLSRAPLILLGEASYAVYILHIPVKLWLNPTLGSVMALSPLAAVLVYVFAVVALSIFVFRFVEEPARRGIRRRFGG